MSVRTEGRVVTFRAVFSIGKVLSDSEEDGDQDGESMTRVRCAFWSPRSIGDAVLRCGTCKFQVGCGIEGQVRSFVPSQVPPTWYLGWAAARRRLHFPSSRCPIY